MRPFYILSINGGGVRGLIVMAFLRKMEAFLKEKNPDFEIYDFFDMYAGTSIGALIVTEFLVQRKKPDNIISFFNENIDRIMLKDVWDKIFGKKDDNEYESDNPIERPYNYKDKQQDLTELNSEGNRDRGRYGEDLSE